MKSNWPLVKLEEVADLTVGFVGTMANHYTSNGVTFLRSTNIDPFNISLDDIKYISPEFNEKLSKSQLRTGDVVIVRTGKPGACAVIPNISGTWNCSDLVIVRPHTEKLDPLFLAAYINLASGTINNQLVGAVQQHFNVASAKRLEIPVPSIDVQRKISSLIGNLNDKISINNKINDNLQQQAMALYASMFLDNPALETTAGTLKDIADITMGQSPSGSSYNEDGNGEVFYQGRAEFGYRFPTRRLYTTEPKRMAEAGDVLLSVRAPVGDLNVAYERCCIGRGLGAIHGRNGYQSFVLYTMFALRPQLDVYNGEGTVFGSINRNALNDMPIDIPSEDAIAAFEAVVRPMDDMIRSNYEENCRLQELRDSLLPRLMSGEVDVSDIEI